MLDEKLGITGSGVNEAVACADVGRLAAYVIPFLMVAACPTLILLLGVVVLVVSGAGFGVEICVVIGR